MVDPASPGANLNNRRIHPRVRGPFDGRRIDLYGLPIRIYDLSLGGCFFEAYQPHAPGRRFTLQMELPAEGWVELQAESVYGRDGYGLAARFVEMSGQAQQRLERVLRRMGAFAAD